MTVGGACATIFIAATRYVEQGGIDSPSNSQDSTPPSRTPPTPNSRNNYPEIRRIIGAFLLDASQRLRMSASGMHNAMVGEMVVCASDVRFALTTHSPVPVAPGHVAETPISAPRSGAVH